MTLLASARVVDRLVLIILIVSDKPIYTHKLATLYEED